MIEFLFTTGQWLGVFLCVFVACLVTACAANDIRDLPGKFGPVNDHDWDALDGARQSRQRLEV
jgi:hypothetical protein